MDCMDCPERLKEMLVNKWDLEPPRIMLAVTGGAQSFDLPPKLDSMLKQGLAKAATSESLWITTGGALPAVFCGMRAAPCVRACRPVAVSCPALCVPWCIVCPSPLPYALCTTTTTRVPLCPLALTPLPPHGLFLITLHQAPTRE